MSVLLLICAIGIFLRAYNFPNWIHFELDQSRDAKVVGLALEQGIGNLPLLGPKAAGSFLRLGPLFYYIEYLSGLIFGNNPVGLATLSLIFSCLTLPLFYLFVRRFFGMKISIALLALFSSSLFLIMYSRFAWNPNNLPFFILGFFYSLLRVTDLAEKRKGWWLVLSSVCFSFASQLHFVALLTLPTVAVIYLIIKRPKITLKFWLISIVVVIFFYIPPIVNDIKTGGENMAEFEKVFLKKSTKNADEHSLMEKSIRSVTETALNYFIVYSGYQKAELPSIREVKPFNFDVVCDNDCKSNIWSGGLAGVILVVGVIFLLANFIPRKEIHQKDFLILVTLWFLVSIMLFVPIAYDLAPRFFLLVAPLPFILIGLVLDFLEKRKFMSVGYFLIIILIFSNGLAIYERFSQLQKAPNENFKIESDKILKERDRVTLKQQLLITDYIESIYKKNKYPVYENSEAFYRRAFLYHLEQRNIPHNDFRNTGKNVYANGNYFLIYPADKSPEEIAYKYFSSYSILEVKNFGTLQVVRLVPRSEAINAVEEIFGPDKKPTSAKGVPVRCRWNEIMGKCNTDGTENDDEI